MTRFPWRAMTTSASGPSGSASRSDAGRMARGTRAKISRGGEVAGMGRTVWRIGARMKMALNGAGDERKGRERACWKDSA